MGNVSAGFFVILLGKTESSQAGIFFGFPVRNQKNPSSQFPFFPAERRKADI